jgi:hypothetical protein
VSSNRYLHPEFGYFAPAPRLRRELCLVVFASLFGTVLGATSMIALSTSYRDNNPSTAGQSQAAQVHLDPNASGISAPAKVQGRADHAETQSLGSAPGETKLARQCDEDSPLSRKPWCSPPTPSRMLSHAADNGPEIARLPLGRPATMRLPPVATGAPLAPELSMPTLPQHPAPATSAAAPEQKAAPEGPSAVPASDAKPHKTVRAQPSHPKEPSARAASLTAAAEGSATAYARNTAYPRTVFWDWTR